MITTVLESSLPPQGIYVKKFTLFLFMGCETTLSVSKLCTILSDSKATNCEFQKIGKEAVPAGTEENQGKFLVLLAYVTAEI
jgi:hypothetical protein